MTTTAVCPSCDKRKRSSAVNPDGLCDGCGGRWWKRPGATCDPAWRLDLEVMHRKFVAGEITVEEAVAILRIERDRRVVSNRLAEYHRRGMAVIERLRSARYDQRTRWNRTSRVLKAMKGK